MKRSVDCSLSSTRRIKGLRPETWIAMPGLSDILTLVGLKWSALSHLLKTSDSTVKIYIYYATQVTI